MVLVDSCIWIESMRRNGDLRVKLALEGLLANDRVLLCGPVLLEVMGGTRITERKRLRALFADVPTYRTTDAIWKDAIEMAWKAKSKGINAPWMDYIIASIARDTSGWIYSTDKHFQAMSECLGFSLYQPGYNSGFNPNYS